MGMKSLFQNLGFRIWRFTHYQHSSLKTAAFLLSPINAGLVNHLCQTNFMPVMNHDAVIDAPSAESSRPYPCGAWLGQGGLYTLQAGIDKSKGVTCIGGY